MSRDLYNGVPDQKDDVRLTLCKLWRLLSRRLEAAGGSLPATSDRDLYGGVPDPKDDVKLTWLKIWRLTLALSEL